MSNVYDVEDLKAQIRQLRSTRSALQQESEALEKEINSLQGKADTIKQQLSIESVNDELRMIGSDVLNDPVNDESNAADDTVDVRRFKLLNDKLDKQILNQDTRQHLPQLETLAATWEKTLRDAQKIARRNEREQLLFPQYYFSPVDKIKEQTAENLQKLSAVRAQAAREAEAQRVRKVPLCQEINLLRRQINALYEEKESSVPVVIRSESAYFKELSRIKFLKKEHVRVRELLSSYHNKFVWQTEAFLKNMKSLDSRMPFSLVPTAVVPWICFSETESPEALLTEDYLRDKVRRLSSSSSSRNRNRHTAHHDSEDEKTQEGKSGEDGEDSDTIGFRTFCRLCEGIIDDFETVSG